MTTLIAAAMALVDSITFDESGFMGQGGNGGLISRKTIDLNNNLRRLIEAEGQRLSASAEATAEKLKGGEQE